MRHSRHFLLFTLLVLLWGVMPLLADPTNVPAPPLPDADDFNPGLGIAAAVLIMIMFVWFALLAGIGLAIGICVLSLAGALAAFGILSSSVAIGFIRRNPASGLRALFLQLGAAAGIPCGIAGAWLVSALMHANWSVAARLVMGSVAGLVTGLLVAWLFNFLWSKIAAWIVARYDRRREKKPNTEVVA